MTTRRDNWSALLETFLADRRERPFHWRDNNCAFFAADWVLELTGEDMAGPLRAKVQGPLSALRIIRQAGGLTVLFDEACSERGWPSVPAAYARRGDLVLTPTERGPAVGISLGHASAFAGPSGLTFKSPAHLYRAWQIA